MIEVGLKLNHLANAYTIRFGFSSTVVFQKLDADRTLSSRSVILNHFSPMDLFDSYFTLSKAPSNSIFKKDPIFKVKYY